MEEKLQSIKSALDQLKSDVNVSYLNNRELPSTQNSFDPAWSKIYPQSSRNNASAFSTLDPN